MKKIPLSQKMFALIDDQDYEFLMRWKWFAVRQNGSIYAIRHHYLPSGVRTTIKMHRVILGLTDPCIFVDHKDGNGINNQRSNIRIATRKENAQNRKTPSNNKSGIKGVCFVPKKGKWKAYINNTHLGYFKTAQEAEFAYNQEAKIRFGEFSRTNILLSEK